MLYHDPRWPRASAWLQQSAGETLGTLAVVGAGATKGSITPGRGDLAPGAIRKALERFSPYDVSHATDVEQIRVRDLGDLEIANLAPADAKPVVSKGVEMALQDVDAHGVAADLLGSLAGALALLVYSELLAAQILLLLVDAL